MGGYFECMECGAGLLPRFNPDAKRHFDEIHRNEEGGPMWEHGAAQWIDLTAEDLADYETRHRLLAARIAYEIPTQIRAMRLARGWTQTELARRAGMSVSRISVLEKITECPAFTLNTLCRIASAFDCALILRFVGWSFFITSVNCFWKECVPAAFDEEFAEPKP